MKVNAKNVEALAKRKFDENHDLRQYLKMQEELSEEELDKLVADTTRRVWAGFDCTSCLAAALGLSEKDFRGRYLEGKVGPEDDDGEGEGEGAPPRVRWHVRGRPCPFLKDNRCTVYEARPEQCRKYPYLYEPEFSSRTLGMIERTFTCPVVYQVFEELKAELPFDQGGHSDW